MNDLNLVFVAPGLDFVVPGLDFVAKNLDLLHRAAAGLPGPALRLAAVRMGGVDAENAHVAREELELLERPRERRVAGMSVDIREKLGGGELAALHVALELGHIDAVG